MQNVKKIIISIFLIGLLIGLYIGKCSATPATTSFSYKDIAELYLPTFGIEENQSAQAPQTGFLGEKKETPLNLQELLTLSDIKKRELTFSLFAAAPALPASNTSSCFPITTLVHDLNMLSFHSKDEALRGNSLLARINGGTLTSFGEATLAYILTHPIAHIPTLQQRQRLVRALIRPEVQVPCQEILQYINTHEAALLACFREMNQIESDTIKKIYFTKSWLKFLNNEYVLGICSRLQDALVAMPVVGTRIIGVLGIHYAQCAVHKHIPSAPRPTPLKELFKQLGHSVYDLYNVFGYKNRYTTVVESEVTRHKEWQADLLKYNNPSFNAAGDLAKAERNIKLSTALALAVGPAVETYLWLLTKKLWDVSVEQYKTTIYLQEKLIGCATLIHATDQIEELAKNCPELQQEVTAWNAHRAAPSSSFKKLLRILRTATFTGSPSYFSRVGRVQKAYMLLQETKHELIPYMELVGLMDAHYAIAQLYTKSLTNKVPYCFATYLDRNHGPYVKAVNFRNPMISSDTIVGNDIEFGETTSMPRAAIITGSNSAGKTAIMVSGVTTMLILAQTLGIAPAQDLQFVPFDYIGTSLKLGDNVVTGESHAVAERNHKNKLYADIKSVAQQGGYAFIAIDELFEGFTPEVGSKALYDFSKQLLTIPELIFIVSTQFQADPTHLEEESNGLCKNYCVDVERAADGTIHRPYKIREGVSSVNIGNDLLK